MSAIKLNGDISTNKLSSITRNLTIDLGGHTYSSNKTSGYLFNANGGKLTLKNGTVNGVYRLGVAQNGGEIVIESGSYTSSRNVAFEAKNGGKITINGGEINSVEGGVIAPAHGGIVEINGGVIESSDNFAIATNGNAGNDANVITINGGRLIGNIKSTGYEAIGVYVANKDVLTMNGGEIIANGGTGICMRGGIVTINDGTITATGVDKNGQPIADGMIGDDPTVATGVSAIVYHKSNAYQNEGMQLIIHGGTINGVDHAIDVIGDEHPNITVDGGTLTPAWPESA